MSPFFLILLPASQESLEVLLQAECHADKGLYSNSIIPGICARLPAYVLTRFSLRTTHLFLSFLLQCFHSKRYLLSTYTMLAIFLVLKVYLDSKTYKYTLFLLFSFNTFFAVFPPKSVDILVHRLLKLFLYHSFHLKFQYNESGPLSYTINKKKLKLD